MAQHAVAAHTAGIVFEIHVQTGASVASGDLLMTLEAMKMHTPLPAPADGVVVDIRVAAQDVVEEGEVLVVLESESS